jgi:hypothetical protein
MSGSRLSLALVALVGVLTSAGASRRGHTGIILLDEKRQLDLPLNPT